MVNLTQAGGTMGNSAPRRSKKPNSVVRCSYKRPRIQGAKRCKNNFRLADDQEKWNFPGVVFYCRLHELTDQLTNDLAVIKCREEEISYTNGLDALNQIWYLSLKSKKFKKIIYEINLYAPILAQRRLESK